MTRLVNGVRVELTPEEEAEVLAEWQRNAAAKPARVKQEKRNELLAEASRPMIKMLLRVIARKPATEQAAEALLLAEIEAHVNAL